VSGGVRQRCIEETRLAATVIPNATKEVGVDGFDRQQAGNAARKLDFAVVSRLQAVKRSKV
jgi:hypothetical protein